jgi:hypothetical protein
MWWRWNCCFGGKVEEGLERKMSREVQKAGLDAV